MIDPRSTRVYKLEKENKQLKTQLQQKESIIKEVREYIKKHSQMTNLQINGIENVLSFRGSVEELLETLDKEVN